MNACCADPKNRTESEQVSENLSVQLCSVCGRRHFEAIAEPIKIGVKGGGL